MSRFLSVFAAAIVWWGLGVDVVAAAGMAPRPAPRFWSAARCERVLPKEHPAIGRIICVGTGLPSSCRWAAGHRVRLYSEMTVFAWYRQANFSSLGMHGLQKGVVRSFVLDTRAHEGFDPVRHLFGDQYLRWPADFYMGHVRLVGTGIGADQFRSRVAKIGATLAQHQQAIDCTA